MCLLFYKKFSIKTSYTPEDIRRIFSDFINKKSTNTEAEKILSEDWYIGVNISGYDFWISIGRNAPRLERSGLHTVLKGKMKENNKQDIKATIMTMTIRPANNYVIGLCLIFLCICMALVYAILNDISSLMIVSYSLLFIGYIVFLIDFNLQVKIYLRMINNWFDKELNRVAGRYQ